jgi:hypothetical protein
MMTNAVGGANRARWGNGALREVAEGVNAAGRGKRATCGAPPRCAEINLDRQHGASSAGAWASARPAAATKLPPRNRMPPVRAGGVGLETGAVDAHDGRPLAIACARLRDNPGSRWRAFSGALSLLSQPMAVG